MVTRRAGAFSIPAPESAEALEPPAKPDGSQLPVVLFRGLPWAVKSMDPVELQREVFVHALGRGLVNVAELRVLRGGQVSRLRSLGVAAAGSVPANTVLSRLAHTYSLGELPQRTLNESAAGELVFSLWLRRRDADVWNRTYIDAGVPVFYDLSVSLDYERTQRSVERFFGRDKFGYAGSWRVGVRPPEALNTARLRDDGDHTVFVDDIDGFVQAAREMRERIASTRFEIRRHLKQAGYSPVHVDEVEEFLRGTLASLEADTERMLEVVLQEP